MKTPARLGLFCFNLRRAALVLSGCRLTVPGPRLRRGPVWVLPAIPAPSATPKHIEARKHQGDSQRRRERPDHLHRNARPARDLTLTSQVVNRVAGSQDEPGGQNYLLSTPLLYKDLLRSIEVTGTRFLATLKTTCVSPSLPLLLRSRFKKASPVAGRAHDYENNIKAKDRKAASGDKSAN